MGIPIALCPDSFRSWTKITMFNCSTGSLETLGMPIVLKDSRGDKGESFNRRNYFPTSAVIWLFLRTTPGPDSLCCSGDVGLFANNTWS